MDAAGRARWASTSPRCPTTSSRGGTRPATPRTRSRGSAPPGQATERDRARHERAHAHAALPPVDHRAGVRHARRARTRAASSSASAPASRSTRRPPPAREWPGGKERRLRLTEAIELIRRLWTRGARRLRRRVLPDAARHDLRPARRAGADLRGRVRPARGEARRPRRRRLHLHQRQEAGAVRAAHRRRRGGRRGRRPRPGRGAPHDRDQGLLRHGRRRRAATTATGGRRSR